MRSRRLLLVLGLGVLYLLGCADHEIQPFQPALTNGRVVGSIHGIITDFCTQAHFDSGAVAISWAVDGQLMTSASKNLGYYLINDLPPGDYVITFVGPNTHAVGRLETHIPTLEEIEQNIPPTDEDYEHSVTANISLYGRNAGLQGTVYRQVDGHTLTLAEGVQVVVDYNRFTDDYDDYDHEYSYVFPSKYTTTTDINGFFSFDSLPGAPYAQLRTQPYFYENLYYSARETYVTLEQNAVVSAGQVVLSIHTPVPILLSENFMNVQAFPVTSAIEMTFSKAMETETFNVLLECYVRQDIGGGDFILDWEEIECAIAWTAGDTQLTITPYKVLTAGTQCRLSLDGVSRDQNAFTLDEAEFTTQPGISFVHTNIENAQGQYVEFPITSNIEVTFSMAVATYLAEYTGLLDPDGRYINGTFSITGTDNTTLRFDPTENLEPGQTYQFSYVVLSNIPGDTLAATLPRFTTQPGITAPAQVTNFRFTNTSMPIDYNTRTFTFRWDKAARAQGYIIYARDSNRNTDHVLIGEFDADDDLSWQSGTVTLPDQFDYFDDDGQVTPFLYGTSVTFEIEAYNEAGLSAATTYGPRTDNVEPTLILHSQSSTADNSGGTTTKTITVQVTSSECLSTLTIDFVDTNNDTEVLSSSTATYSLSADKYTATITIHIPDHTTAAGDRIRVAGTDTSTNTADPAVSMILF